MREYSSQSPVEMMAKVLGVSRAGYYKYLDRKLSTTKQYDEILTKKIKLIHMKSKEIYGSPRIHAELKKQGEKCSRKRVVRL